MSSWELPAGLYSSPTETVRPTKNTSEYQTALGRLDRLGNRIDIWNVTDVVGVVADIKPSSIVTYDPELAEAAEGLGLSACVFSFEDEFVAEMTLSKDSTTAEELAYLFTDAEDGDDRFRRIGSLLGYPKSATEYFIRRRETLLDDDSPELPVIIPEEIVGTVHNEFCQLILSPDNWRAELDEYLKPLAQAVQALTPETYRRIDKSARRRKMARALLKKLGTWQSKFPDDIDVQYVR